MQKTIELIALLAMAAADTGLPADVQAGSKFECPADLADALVQSGKAKPAEAEKPMAKTVAVRVLQDCAYGKANDLVQLPEPEVKTAQKAGLVDANKAAVEYAASLDQNRQ